MLSCRRPGRNVVWIMLHIFINIFIVSLSSYSYEGENFQGEILLIKAVK